jgi:replication factor A1
MRNKTSPGEYLAFLSTKYEVDADSLFHALISAEENRKSKCGNLSIECRGKQRNKIILLITKDSKVVAQFPVSREFLLEQNNPIKDAQKADVLCRHLMKKDREPHSFQIKDLRIGMKKVSLKAEVLEIAKPMLVFTRFGNYATVTNALIGDKTGQIKLCLWNEQIDSISIGETIQIENASISTFRGERQLRIGKKGILHSVKSMIAN